jgi:hypothetical protein
LKFAELHGTVLILKDSVKNFVEWSGEYGDVVKLAGNHCTQISSHVNKNGTMYFLEENLSESINILRQYVNNDFYFKSTAVQNPYGSTQLTEYFELTANERKDQFQKLECFFCPRKRFEIKKMRQHIGIHMVLNLIPINPTTCGFCGVMGCSLSLETNVPGKNAPKCPASNCKFAHKFSLKAAEKISKNSPCTNRPVECYVCKIVIWSYNIKVHYERDHIGYDIPSMISEDEVFKLKNIGI